MRNASLLNRVASILAVLLLAACQGETAPLANAAPVYKSVLVKDVPHVRQKPDFCGEACAAAFLLKLGEKVDQDYVFDQSGLSPLEGRGCYTQELAAALRRIGFDIGRVWIPVAADNAVREMETQFAALHADLLAGTPSIICTHYDDRPNTTEHFRLILGYDARSDEVIYHEPAVDNGAHLRMKRQQMIELWPLKYQRQKWSVVRMPLKFLKLRGGQAATSFTSADYAQHVMKLKRKIPGRGFHIVIQPPFVVIGDEAPAVVKRRAVDTVQWAVDRLKRDYFEKDPSEILDIWLFKDKESYAKHTRKIFNDEPTTPFGYYSPQHRALVMNIATGGGTLVHEIVHPFIASNFPKCPAWFNEGFASLYEQSGERDGRIYGRTNWRLAGLQQAIQAGRVPTFKELCSTTTRQFYHQDPGTNYSQARYLCYHLQEKGLLVKYYRQFRQAVDQDPTGRLTLAKILGERDMAAFKKKWEAWIMTLKF